MNDCKQWLAQSAKHLQPISLFSHHSLPKLMNGLMSTFLKERGWGDDT